MAGKERFMVTSLGRAYEVWADPGSTMETVWLSQKSWFGSDVKVMISDSYGRHQIFCNEENAPVSTQKGYYFIMDVCSKRTGECIGKKTGVIFARSEEEAETIAWDKHGNDVTCRLSVVKVPNDGYCFTVYKSEF